MKPWVTVGTAAAPDGTPLVLQQRGAEFSLRMGGQVLMTSRSHGSEDALAAWALNAKMGHVLVGGLGMGYTLRAALDVVGPRAKVTVAEFVPAVVDWNKGPLADLAGRPMDDRRVAVDLADVRDTLAKNRGEFDAVLLDVDNGPNAMTMQREEGPSLYSTRGLARIFESLKPGGAFGLWSAAQEPLFVKRLERAGFREAEMRPAGGRHAVFVARRP